LISVGSHRKVKTGGVGASLLLSDYGDLHDQKSQHRDGEQRASTLLARFPC
jgi:hypothetical protein